MTKDLKAAILAALLDAQGRTGSPLLRTAELAKRLAIPAERIDDACRELEIDHTVVCTPVVGEVEMVCLTVNGVRRARRSA